ncbi:Low affinity iron permease-domain-containing protein [Hypoxylon fuscum]|nr:Low affinity iron permease-domain-containing protein [Hypoxylon fuscum]
MGFSPIQGVKNFFNELRSAPEAQYSTEAAAPTQIAPAFVPEKPTPAYVKTATVSEKEIWDEKPLPARPSNKSNFNGLDFAVKAAGSNWALGFTVLLLVAWAVWGIVAGPTDTWQVILQDTSSIQAYISATLLLRQQQTSCRGILGRICGLISRSASNERMLRSLPTKDLDQLKLARNPRRADVEASTAVKRTAFGKIANVVAASVGSLIFLGIYWTGIFVWVFSGIPLQFSDTWQLDINTATALQISLTTMFLQNIRRQHDEHLELCIKSIDLVDADVEVQLRQLTGDQESNAVVKSEPPVLSKAQKAIDIYAFIVGGSIGVTISCAVFILWIAVGNSLEFDDNWWLIIGTYTGLMGFIDGFIMKNVDHRETALAERHFQRLADQDYSLFRLMDIEMPEVRENPKLSLNQRLSKVIGNWCGSTAASYTAVLTVFTLIIIASAMQWTETGQLLCNTPTMIVEGFLLITLLQAHNMADDKRRDNYDIILKRRIILQSHFTA